MKTKLTNNHKVNDGLGLLRYPNFISKELFNKLECEAEKVPEIDGLQVKKRGVYGSSLSEELEALKFVCSVYEETRSELQLVLQQRKEDRSFIDQETKKSVERNIVNKVSFHDDNYETVLFKRNNKSEVVVGPIDSNDKVISIADIPSHLKGPHITLFGPVDDQKMAINAMNAWHRKGDGENSFITEMVNKSGILPMWGADNEDSKTPDYDTFSSACKNLVECFKGTISFQDDKTGKNYKLEKTNLSRPIKRPPGLAIPSCGHIYKGEFLPLHLFDICMHLYHCWENPEALTFYIPKLENEKEARYIKNLLVIAESRLKDIQPSYEIGSIKVLVVFENPRAIFRVKEIIQELFPFFAGGSLGWHDYLASTARLFRMDPNYRIPIKSDPEIVIKHIKTSHYLLADEVGKRGGVAIGGMYGILPEAGNRRSYNLAITGFIRDVLIQLKRGLTGFWVAHPDFVRVGIALTFAWERYTKDKTEEPLLKLIESLIPDEAFLEKNHILDFVKNDNTEVFQKGDTLFERNLLAANIGTSSNYKNNDPEEVRYNIFQALQYLVDWLAGNGCVALPAILKSKLGEDTFVRIMDDLATTERSRWELWAEIFHGRLSLESFLKILGEEIYFIKQGLNTKTKKTQIVWNDISKKWYPVAVRCLIKLVTEPNPCEFSTEILLPFTLDVVKNDKQPWEKAKLFDPEKYQFSKKINHFLENELKI